MTPIDLKKLCGRRWKVELEESAAGRWKDPWLFVVPCRHGHLFAAGPDRIGAATNHSGAIARRLRAVPGVEVSQDGDDGLNVTFSPAALKYVARVMRPRSCRRLTPTHAAALARGRLLKKTPSQSAGGGAGSPIGGKPAGDTPVAERPSTGPDFTSQEN